ncbi:sulfur oxidation c-type cytochrome SoxX [Methylopila jiangsuensis]|jgi:sulfur-oxidizing protein SoxX|uniref:Sulfur oxidation c-type cytochrome SoxX n=1 Tax=Methylopila jiangsuensis TaxID=586230 RepID=A0A9W6JF92_9HYPH|nr:sulfur oxidation c-type cytochrome SoxX [Methylopila jiangsuensis]MDR6287044.1 sulfur-oxidizing protein SoxX [Methylopila jiangsuensis]GLK76530.1 sulfur oxidation c-type cytochrome SoxX [Methylopila jiangsuensis]
MKNLIIGLVALALAAPALAADSVSSVDAARVEKTVTSSFTNLPEGWDDRLKMDEAQRICTETRNQPSEQQADKIVEAEKAKVKMPDDGKVLGDWKAGEKVAQNGRGFQFSDPAGTEAGGNCYACHQLDPKETSYGTLGPSLKGYGKTFKFTDEAAKATYAKIFDAQAVLACSNMPRFGTNHVLNEKQMKDVTAYLFDPESPVNK